MIFRYWLEAQRLWYMPWKWRVYEWVAYEGERWSKSDRQMIATAVHAKSGRYIKELFNNKEDAEYRIYQIMYGDINSKEVQS